MVLHYLLYGHQGKLLTTSATTVPSNGNWTNLITNGFTLNADAYIVTLATANTTTLVAGYVTYKNLALTTGPTTITVGFMIQYGNYSFPAGTTSSWVLASNTQVVVIPTTQ